MCAEVTVVILVGCAGYSYKDWKGVFYPEGLKDSEMLSYYATQFPFCEINYTFYRIPDPVALDRMQAQTPEGFRFFIKAYQGITHDRADTGLFPQFRDALRPIEEAGKLGGVLAQFPNSFRNNDENRDYLRLLRQALGDLPVAVEFRHREWVQDECTFHLLEEERLGFVCVDEPQYKSLMPPLVRATAEPGYVRFHGRNYQKWWKHERPEERYDYLYSEAELREWVSKLQSLERQAETVYVSMNNHRRGQATINGRMIRDLLREAGANAPAAPEQELAPR